MTAWEQVAERAAQQHGVVGRRDMEQLRVDRRRLDGWVSRRFLSRVAPGVWRVNGTPETWEQQLRIGLLYLGDDAMVSHEAAAQLHRFDRTPPDRIEFLVPLARRRWALPVGLLHTSKRIERLDRVVVDGWPVTSATRTVLDLAMRQPGRERLEAAIDSAVRMRLSAPIVLQRRLEGLRGPGRWGCRLVDELTIDAGGESVLERRFLELLRRNGLPRPTTQRWFRIDGRSIGRADFTFDEHRMVVEVSGGRGHSSPAERAKDAQRRNELQDIGQQVFEYTWEDVSRRPTYVARTMRERLAGQTDGTREGTSHGTTPTGHGTEPPTVASTEQDNAVAMGQTRWRQADCAHAPD